ncbi:sodium:alanine symporter [Litchfieldella anticariensis FP35 = DSM 16096]|uniref:Sodium:alanine symporter n=1 Tax=Litchfieldella anticariensis (strain DSM 16096 / CECT 5854 / CIP 108499 / LMG 22089 / FP35) TaxID=1121939 RepID=S2KQJ9_LITA3|nr:sodium:alanine symporter family protein [Halomonas anticariensis]EPC04337.1 sodium:alanine symporter [Halomonas anticariensis FP35 = DSM 16096]
METLNSVFSAINSVVWGPLMLILLLGVGLYLQLGLKLMPIRKLGMGFKLMFQGRVSAKDDEKEGEISPFNALMTALSATIGTGNIAGVATAIALGGPGAVFWMWITALVGMATKFAEAVLAVRYREVDDLGNHVGGPMFYIRNGLGKKWAWLGGAFAFFGAVAAFGIGNTVQSNSVADALDASFGMPHWLTGVVIMVLAGAVILGGIKRIAKVAGKLVPIMGIAYVIAGLAVLIVNASQIGSAFSMIFYYAFNPHAAVGGFAGAAVMAAIRFGVARGIFSNEAGLGSAPIAHAAAQTKNPVRQGLIAMLGTFIDTIIVCSITALVILTSTVWETGEEGASLTAMSFEAALPGVGNHIVSIALAVFAFTTILGWSFYGEKCFEYLFGVRSITLYRVLFVLAIPVGALAQLGLIWLMADTFNAMMAIPNLIALALLSPMVFKLTKDFFDGKDVLPGEELK